MRKINMSWQSVLLSVALLGLAACTGDFEDINRNPNQVTEEQMDALNYKTGTKFKSLQSLVIPVQEHMYQFNESLSGGPFGGYIGATVDTWQTKFETYNPSADWRYGVGGEYRSCKGRQQSPLSEGHCYACRDCGAVPPLR